jgi:hypothetical protein
MDAKVIAYREEIYGLASPPFWKFLVRLFDLSVKYAKGTTAVKLPVIPE